MVHFALFTMDVAVEMNKQGFWRFCLWPVKLWSVCLMGVTERRVMDFPFDKRDCFPLFSVSGLHPWCLLYPFLFNLPLFHLQVWKILLVYLYLLLSWWILLSWDLSESLAYIIIETKENKKLIFWPGLLSGLAVASCIPLNSSDNPTF